MCLVHAGLGKSRVFGICGFREEPCVLWSYSYQWEGENLLPLLHFSSFLSILPRGIFPKL